MIILSHVVKPAIFFLCSRIFFKRLRESAEGKNLGIVGYFALSSYIVAVSIFM